MIEPKYQTMIDKYRDSIKSASTCKQRVARTRAFFEWLKKRPIDASTLKAYQKHLVKHYAGGTIKLDMDIIHRMCTVNEFKWPLPRGENPIVNEREVYAPRLDPLDIQTMINVVRGILPSQSIKPTPQHQAFLCMSTIWGMRRHEMAEMTADMLDKKNGLIFVETAKHGRQRYHSVPDFLWPYLEDYSYKRINVNRLSIVFQEIKAMIGFTGEISDEIGWHSIRRSLDKELELAGVMPSDIHSFFRWKRSTRDMQSRYATTVMVGTRTTEMDLGREDKDTDARVLDKHPFLPWWE